MVQLKNIRLMLSTFYNRTIIFGIFRTPPVENCWHCSFTRTLNPIFLFISKTHSSGRPPC